jgi:hypothetical protein
MTRQDRFFVLQLASAQEVFLRSASYQHIDPQYLYGLDPQDKNVSSRFSQSTGVYNVQRCAGGQYEH